VKPATRINSFPTIITEIIITAIMMNKASIGLIEHTEAVADGEAVGALNLEADLVASEVTPVTTTPTPLLLDPNPNHVRRSATCVVNLTAGQRSILSENAENHLISSVSLHIR
jgi:hypothetical protein